MFTIIFGGSITLLIFTLWLWNHWHFNYWRRQVGTIAHIPALPFVGNVWELLRYRCCFGEQFQALYNHMAARGQSFVGIHVLHNHALLLREPTLIKRVLVRDFSVFASRFETTDARGDAMGSLNLFFAKYDVWKEIHYIFSPLFAYGKIKQMYPLLEEIAHNLETHLAKRLAAANSNSIIIEVKEMAALFTTDVIASIAFGLNANSLENANAEFRRMCIEVNEPRLKRIFHLFVMFFFPQLAQTVGTHLYSPEYEQFMRNAIEYALTERKRSQKPQRHDLIDIFIALQQQQKASSSSKSSVLNRRDFFVAQAAFLLLAGFDTSSSTITFALYELAKQPQLQKRLRTELRAALAEQGCVLSYEAVQELPYLRMVVDEVLRLYPPTSFLDRCCTAPMGYALEPYSKFRIPQGMPVYISVLALHRDEQFWPDPLQFDPERFSPSNRKMHTPMSYLPFGAGPRGCIGYQLGLLEVKMGLIHILKNYYVRPCEQTLPEMRFDPKTFVLAAEGGTFLQFTRNELN